MTAKVTLPIKLPSNYETAAATFARTGSVAKAARRSGATMGQVEDWLEEPAFERLVKAEQKHLEKQTIYEIQRSGPEAVRLLRRMLHQKQLAKATPLRIQAARTLIEFWMKAQEVFTLRREIDAVKEQLRLQQGSVVIDMGNAEETTPAQPEGNDDEEE